MKYNIFIFFLLLSMTAFAQPSQYTPMTAQGYQFKRILCDSTLHLPSFCGVPNLRNSTAKNGALAMDTCNSRLYKWTNGAGWSIVGGTTIDTTSLSNRIDARVKYTDTAAMLQPYLLSIDTTDKWVVNVEQVDDTTIRIFKGTTSTDITIHAGGGSGTTPDLQAVTSVGAITDQMVSMNWFGIFNTDYNKTVITDLANYYPFYATYPTQSAISYIQMTESATSSSGHEYEYFNGITSGDHVKLNPDVLEMSSGGGGSTVQIIPTFSLSDLHYLPISDNTTDTLATLADVRAGGGGGGTTITSDTAKVVIMKVHNAESTTLQRGEVVYLFGANGDLASVKRANNKQDATSANTIGFVRRNIAAGDTGYVTTQGQIEKLNLGSYTAGQIVYLDSISGQFTTTKPSAPYHLVYLGVIERANNGNGLLYVKPQNGYEIDELHDVKITSKTNNDVIVYESATNLWKNKQVTDILPMTDTSGTYSSTITWTGTTAPSGTANHSFRFTRVGKQVTANIHLNYGTAGTLLTAVQMSLPASFPTPAEPAGLGAASEMLYPAYGYLNTGNTVPSSTPRAALRVNPADNGWELYIVGGAGNYKAAWISVTYYTN